MNQNFKVLSLFSSAGIGELGIEAAGLSILVSNELLQNRCDLYRENYPNVDNICGDIWGKEEEIIDRWQGPADGISSRNVHLCFKLFLRNPCYYNRMISSSESVRPDIEINDGGYSL